VNTANYMVG